LKAGSLEKAIEMLAFETWDVRSETWDGYKDFYLIVH
jgi:hypothetical protein